MKQTVLHMYLYKSFLHEKDVCGGGAFSQSQLTDERKIQITTREVSTVYFETPQKLYLTFTHK